MSITVLIIIIALAAILCVAFFFLGRSTSKKTAAAPKAAPAPAPTPAQPAPAPAPSPAPQAAESPTQRFQSLPAEDMPTVSNISDASILIVDDDIDLLDYFVFEFSDICKKVYMAKNGREAIRVLSTNNVDIVVSDVMMPEMDGFELCRYIKTNVSVSHIPVILLTARADENSRILGYKNGADDYITKPFKMSVLAAAVNRLFLKHEAVRQQYASAEPAPKTAEVTFSSADEEFLGKFETLVKDNISDPDLDTQRLVDGMGLSRTVLFNKVKQLTGLNIQNYVNKMRMEYVIELMKTTDLSLGEVAEKSGFSSPRYFSTSFKNYTGLTPSQYKKEKLNR